MKKQSNMKIRLWLMLLVAWACCDGAQAERLSFAQADSLLVQRNHALRSARWM